MGHLILVTSATAAGLLLAAASAEAPDHPAIQRAVQRGVAYLKGAQQKDGHWLPASYQPGITALAGLALLECGVPNKDAAVQRAAAAVRRDFLKIGTGRHVYSAATVLLFLDRLGEVDDEPLIDTLVYWLLTGQTGNGTWGYSCEPLPPRELLPLKEYLELSNAAAPGHAGSKGGKDKLKQTEEVKEGRQKMQALAKQIQERMRQLAKQPQTPPSGPGRSFQYAVRPAGLMGGPPPRHAG